MSKPDAPSRARAISCGLPGDGTPAEITAAFLRALPADQFVPPEEAAVAVNALAGTALPLSARGEAVAASDLGAEVAGFAAAFWSLPPADRRPRWAGLSARCGDNHLRNQLTALQPGLDVEVKPHPDPTTEELAALVRELFVLPPHAQALRRVAWLAERADRYKAVVDCACRLIAENAATIHLNPVLFAWFSNGYGCPVPAAGVFDNLDREERWAPATREFRDRLAESGPRTPAEERDHANARFILRGGCILIVGFYLAVALFSQFKSLFWSH
jgi:hypothetical protein